MSSNLTGPTPAPAERLQLGSDLTGVDLAALLSRLGGGSVEDGNGRAVTERGTTPR